MFGQTGWNYFQSLFKSRFGKNPNARKKRGVFLIRPVPGNHTDIRISHLMAALKLANEPLPKLWYYRAVPVGIHGFQAEEEFEKNKQRFFYQFYQNNRVLFFYSEHH